MIIEKGKDSILLKELTEEEMKFFEDKINFWKYLQEKKEKSGE